MFLSRTTYFTALTIAFFSFVGEGNAAPISVTCSGGAQLSTAISTARATAKPGDVLDFLVTGNCVDSISSSEGLYIKITGNGTGAQDGYGAKITANTTTDPAISVYGGLLVLNNVYVTSAASSTAKQVAVVGNGSALRVLNSKIVSIDTFNTLEAQTSGTLNVLNSVISGAKNSAIEVGTSASLWIFSENGKSSSVSYSGTQGGQAIGCWGGWIGGTTTGTGTLTIGPSTAQGISSRGCNATFGIGSTKGSVQITQASDAGIRAKSGDAINLVNVSVSNNPNIGVEVSAGAIEFDNSLISKPSATAVALSARRDGIIYFNNIYGVSTVSWTGTNTNFYNCRQGGKVYGVSGNPTGSAATSGCLVTSDTVTR